MELCYVVLSSQPLSEVQFQTIHVKRQKNSLKRQKENGENLIEVKWKKPSVLRSKQLKTSGNKGSSKNKNDTKLICEKLRKYNGAHFALKKVVFLLLLGLD